jgi:cell division protein FtsL
MKKAFRKIQALSTIEKLLPLIVFVTVFVINYGIPYLYRVTK